MPEKMLPSREAYDSGTTETGDALAAGGSTSRSDADTSRNVPRTTSEPFVATAQRGSV